MLPVNRFVFKEWAVVCAALHGGRYSLILRKGGIHEGREGFRAAHREFWLFPTNFHQSPDDLAENNLDLWSIVRRETPADDVIRLRDYAVVEEVIDIQDEAMLPRLAGLHAWSDRVLHERFHYKRPGLFALLVRAYRLPAEIVVPNSPHFAGCRSWVDFPAEFSTAELLAVLDDDRHAARLTEIRRRLAGEAIV